MHDLSNTKDATADPANHRPRSDPSLPIEDQTSHMLPTTHTVTDNPEFAQSPPAEAFTSTGSGATSAPAHNSDYYTFAPIYPEPVSTTGTLDRFLRWIPMPRDRFTETCTILYWERIFQYFTTGWLCKVTAIDLDQKERPTRLPRVTVAQGEGSRQGQSGGRDRSRTTDNNNKPDSVITYLSAKLEERVCMVIKAKPAANWGVEIVKYTMKGRRDDGCPMGLIVAGHAYRFFYWDEQERLYAVVPTSMWKGPDTLSFSSAMDIFEVDNDPWSFSPLTNGILHMLRSRRNLYRIFSYLEEQVASIILKPQQRSQYWPLLLGGCPPDLEDATHVRVMGAWDQLRGPSRPATNGLEMRQTLKALGNLPGESGGQAGPRGNVDQDTTGPPGTTDLFPEDTGDHIEQASLADAEDEISDEEESLEKALAEVPEWARDTHGHFYHWRKAELAERQNQQIATWLENFPER